MNSKRNSVRNGTDEPVQVFRQFAWHLAGSLAAGKSGAATRPARPARSGKR